MLLDQRTRLHSVAATWFRRCCSVILEGIAIDSKVVPIRLSTTLITTSPHSASHVASVAFFCPALSRSAPPRSVATCFALPHSVPPRSALRLQAHPLASALTPHRHPTMPRPTLPLPTRPRPSSHIPTPPISIPFCSIPPHTTPPHTAPLLPTPPLTPHPTLSHPPAPHHTLLPCSPAPHQCEVDRATRHPFRSDRSVWPAATVFPSTTCHSGTGLRVPPQAGLGSVTVSKVGLRLGFVRYVRSVRLG